MVPAACKAFELPEPEPEFRFAPPRRWRFDFAWPFEYVALEIEGGAFVAGRHTRGAGFIKDLEKYNTAAALGWTVFRVLPRQLQDQQTYDWIKAALINRPGVIRDSNGRVRPRVPHDGQSYDQHQLRPGGERMGRR